MSDGSLTVLMVVHGFPPEFEGGTELYALHLAKALQSAGHEVHAFVGSKEGRATPEVETTRYEGIPVHRVFRQGLFVDNWDKSYAPEVEAMLRSVIAEVRPDVVHVHHWVRLTRTLVMACEKMGVPTVATLHDTWTSCPRCFRIRDDAFCARELSVESCLDCVPRDPWHGDEELSQEIELFRDDFRQELRLAHRVIAPSEAHRDLVATTTELDPGRITVVPHGTLADLQRVEVVEAPDGRVRLGHWGHLFRMKGFHLLLEAIGKLPEADRSRFSVTCWGEATDPDYRAELDRLAEGLDVTWKGVYQHDDLNGAELDWAVFPSMAHESYSFALDEAFALGVPVIASDRGALGSRVGAAGLSFAAEDSGALATILSRILREPGLAAHCRAHLPTLVTMNAHAEVLGGIYREVIAEGPTGEQPDRELSDRHRVHRSFRMEERIRQLLDERGRSQQERGRADGIESEFRKAEAAAATREEHIASLDASIEQWRQEFERIGGEAEDARADYRKLMELHRELVERHQKLEEELELGKRRLYAALDELKAEAEEATVARKAAEERLADAVEAVDADREVIRNLEKAVESARAKAESAARTVGAHEAEIEDLNGKLESERERVRAAQAEVAKGREEIAEREAGLESARADVERIAKELNAEKTHAAALATEKAELGGRAVSLQTALDVSEAKCLDVLGGLAALATELGLDPAIAGDGTGPERLARVLDALVPVIIESRNLMGELARSVEQVTEEAQRIEEERGRLAARIAERDRARDERRRHFWYRLAEKWAGGDGAGASGAMRAKDDEGSDRLRVVMVVHDFLPRHSAGTEIYTYRLAAALQERGAYVHLVYTEARQGVHSYDMTVGEYEGVPYTEISHQHTTRYFERTYRDPQMERLFESILDEHKPNVVHFQHLHHHSIGYVDVAKARGLPVVYTLHEYMLLCPRGGQMLREDLEICDRPIPEKCADCVTHLSLEEPPVDEGRARLSSRVARHVPDGMKEGMKRLKAAAAGELDAGVGPSGTKEEYAAAITTRLEVIKAAADKVDLFISPSGFLRQKFVDCGMIAPDRIIASDNGQDDSPFAGIRRTRSDSIRLGYIGTICDYKGVHVIVDAMNAVTDLESVTCDIFGSLESFPDYAQGLPDRVSNPRTQLRGRYKPQEVGRVLSELDAIIVPSLWYENSPLTIHEAFMAGIPVIASNLGGMAEYVHHGENGLLFDVGDAEDLARRIRDIVAEPELLGRLRNNAVHIKTIEQDAHDMEIRYRRLVAGLPAVEGAAGGGSTEEPTA